MIALLASEGVIKTAQEALDVQNITICVEMLFAAMGHLYAFPYKGYAEANINGQGNLAHSILHALNFSDLVYDTMHQVHHHHHLHFYLTSTRLGNERKSGWVKTRLEHGTDRLNEHKDAS